MSTECYPSIRASSHNQQIDAAINAAFSTSSAVGAGSGQYPGRGDIVVSVGARSEAISSAWPSMEVCITATWADPFNEVALDLLGNVCGNGKSATPALAKAHAYQDLVARFATIERVITAGYRAIAEGRQDCHLESARPLTQVVINIDGKKLGPYEGTRFDLHCLPARRLGVTYLADGYPYSYDVSPAMCSGTVALPVGSRDGPVDAAAADGGGVPLPGGGGNGSDDPIHGMLFAGAGVTLTLGLLGVMLARAAWSASRRGWGTAGRHLPVVAEVPASVGMRTAIADHEGRGARMPQNTACILFLASNPTPTSQLALDAEARAIEAKIWAAEHRDAMVLKTRWAVRFDDVLQALNQDHPAVVHFSGHGAGADGIVLHHDDGGVHQVAAGTLKRLFTTLKDDIRVVVLNACYTSGQARAIVDVIDCVIGMQDKIGDDAARNFAASFYRALGFGRSVRNAFEQGLLAIEGHGLPDAEIPELFVRPGVDADNVLVISSPVG